MKLIDKVLNLIGLQRLSKNKSLEKIKQENCDHEWFSNGNELKRISYLDTTIYCPKCNKERIVSWNIKDRLIRAREIKEEYEKTKQRSIDGLFEELTKK